MDIAEKLWVPSTCIFGLPSFHGHKKMPEQALAFFVVMKNSGNHRRM
jgi:hypothetical protein